jgi:rSAM/selenodomain-associated transferase 2/rSAM/selenodomain-associated transferase 1
LTRVPPEPPPLLGVVIPALNESEELPRLLGDLNRLPVPHRVVVADGGSTDGTREVAAAHGAGILEAPRGRARQMNEGARTLQTPWLLFLHADSRLPEAACRTLAEWIPSACPDQAGYFGFALQGPGRFWRFIEFGQRLRERVSGLVYGDQGLVLSRELFDAVGGFPELPLMEDLEMVRILRREGRVRRLPANLPTSPRRYREGGRWKGWLRNSALVTLYLAGVSPQVLARFYPARRPFPARHCGGAQQREAILMVFAKAPVPGRVKTRLAAEVGPDEAARIYRELGRRVVDQVRGGPYRTVVCYDPPEARTTVAEWLGGEKLEFRPQAAGSLGERLEAAFRRAFQETGRAMVIGTDAPGVDAARVKAALRALDTADLVLGPALDGGYYLLGLGRPTPELFRDIPWSTSEVLAATRSRARALGLTERLLPALRDVDTLEDWRKTSS